MDGLLFLNGDSPQHKTLSEIKYQNFYTVCADGAFDYLSKYCLPDVLVGDFDSLKTSGSPHLLKAKKIIKLSTEKDYTDGHIAMQELINLAPKKIYIYGAFGGDPDHQMSNFSLLWLSSKNKIPAIIVSEKFNVHFVQGDFTCKTKIGKKVSLVPFTDQVHILGTRGLKYTLDNEILDKLHIKGISNLSTAQEVGYSIKKGAALVFVQN